MTFIWPLLAGIGLGTALGMYLREQGLCPGCARKLDQQEKYEKSRYKSWPRK